ncbi:NAD(P)/FAD-dependent oxidoreductase [Paenibacillus eucommiae]|uniref:Glycine/D-amino acid oxidase-like deaminating enzyme n=1 Tax=Paenibacillus eucommiae TaxID=1355755 RepID=A0ABS4J129_9BACL|nr:FAD-dependent oxidoreductase [Paenibacillus eucommiae]MBP1992489.1 glycine/D-amino acid oxidase-like deaminating enzyme [Paenibacillus eucommiae]
MDLPMDLHTGELAWPYTLPTPPVYPELKEHIECDVLVIGSGVCGALIAYHLMERQIDTVLVEKRRVASGSSSANTGLLQFSNDKHLTSCIHTFGERKGVRLYELSRQAVQDLGKISSQLQIDPEYTRRDSLYLATSTDDVPKLKVEYETLLKYGFDVTYLEPETIASTYAFSRPGAIFSRGDAEINPYRLAISLVHESHGKGLRVYENTEILRHTKHKDHQLFHTKTHTIKARKAVFATGYETQSIKHNSNAVLSSTYALVTGQVRDFNGWPGRCLIWETSRPFLYIRTTTDNRIVIGGFDEQTIVPEERNRKLPRKKDQLLQEIFKLFPQFTGLNAEYFWSAVFGETHDGYPLIGPQAGFPDCYFALGYGGNGTVFSMIAAQIISDLITTGEHPDADLFHFGRNSRDKGVKSN